MEYFYFLFYGYKESSPDSIETKVLLYSRALVIPRSQKGVIILQGLAISVSLAIDSTFFVRLEV